VGHETRQYTQLCVGSCVFKMVICVTPRVYCQVHAVRYLFGETHDDADGDVSHPFSVPQRVSLFISLCCNTQRVVVASHLLLFLPRLPPRVSQSRFFFLLLCVQFLVSWCVGSALFLAGRSL
jgi:hypothetical protein